MKIPGFNAEASLYRTSKHYHMAGTSTPTPQVNILVPQFWWNFFKGLALTRAMYAGCYYACVADTGEWQECGDTCEDLKL